MTTCISAPHERDGDTPRPPRLGLRGQEPGPAGEILAEVAAELAELASDPGALFDVGSRSAGDYHAIVFAIADARSALQALGDRAAVAFAEATERDAVAEARAENAHEGPAADRAERRARRAVASRIRQDLSMATRKSTTSVGRDLAAARRLVGTMPETLDALAHGRMMDAVAHMAAGTVGPLEPEEQREVDQEIKKLLPLRQDEGTGRWKADLAKLVRTDDPQKAADRHHRERRSAHVTLTHEPHGMATLKAYLPAVGARAAMKRLELESERLRAEGDDRGHQAIMADSLVRAITGEDGGLEPVTLEVGAIITDRALFDPGTDDVAHIEGYGPVPPELVREQLRRSLEEPAPGPDGQPPEEPLGPDGPAMRVALRRLYTHPRTGELVAVESVARAFPPALKRLVRWRDGGTCRGPFCNAAPRQLDHVEPHSRGGVTAFSNGQGTCVHHNDKENNAAGVETTGTGASDAGHGVRWTSFHGITRTTYPARYTRSERERGGEGEGAGDEGDEGDVGEGEPP
ncbi:HNH endonuclease [Brachybacterium sp. DNPG3]